MKSVRIGSFWGLAIFSLGIVACSDQAPLVPEELEPQFGKPADPPVEVDETDPPEAEQDTTLNVRVLGSGFDRGSQATWLLAGEPRPDQVRTNSTKYVSDKELKANITISLDATVAKWDVEVMTRRGKKGIGIEAFQVKEKTPPGQVEFDDYVQIDLGTLGRKRGISRAGNVSEPFSGGLMLITGRSQEDGKSREMPVMWEVTVTESDTTVVGPMLMPLPPPNDFSGRGQKMSDDAQFISGTANENESHSNPVRWRYQPGSGVTETVIFEPFEHDTDPDVAFASARGHSVNIHGDVAGYSKTWQTVIWDIDGDGEPEFEATTIATSWDGTTGDATPLLSPLRGRSIAWDINNQGYVIGRGYEPSQSHNEELDSHAVLWFPDGTPCDLGEPGVMSGAYNLTDLSGAGTILVSGASDHRGAVWEVEPNEALHTCPFVQRWTMDVEGKAAEIMVLESGWETAGKSQVITPGHDSPIVWRKDATGLTLTPLAGTGDSFGRNGLGDIVGYTPVNGLEHAILWLPKNE
jgi:hypothetical protein